MPPSKLDMEQSSWNALNVCVILVLKSSMPKAKDFNSTIAYYHGMVLKAAWLQPCLLPHHFAFTLPVPFHFTF